MICESDLCKLFLVLLCMGIAAVPELRESWESGVPSINLRMRKAAWMLGIVSRTSKAAAAVTSGEGGPALMRDVNSDTQQQQDPKLSSYTLLLTPARLEARFWTSVK
jgi:hypothetical protein